MSDHQRGYSDLSGQPVSLWIDTTPETGYPSLQGDVRVDVAIVGGGMAGLLAATMLKESGRSVAVIEARKVAQGVSGNTTAKVTSQHHLCYASMLGAFGRDDALAYASANQAAIEGIRVLAERHGIDCDFTATDAYVYSHDEAEVETLKEEVEAARSLGLPAAFTAQVPLPFDVAGAAVFADQARFHPRSFLLGLAAALPGDGSHVFERTRVLDVNDGQPCTVETEWGTVTADDVIIASHYPLNDRGPYTLRLKPKRSLVLGVLPEAPLPAGLERSMLISTDPMHSLRTQKWRDREMLLVGGEPFKTGQADTVELFLNLERWTRERFGDLRVVYRWATQDNVTPDNVPFTGLLAPGAEHCFVTTGYRGWGMTNSYASAALLHDLILGRENPAAAIYDPNRLKLQGLSQVVTEAADAVRHLVADRFRSVDAHSIPPGSGGVIKEGIRPVAVYRDEDGNEHRMSAVCTHLGCVVGWNEAERSWDCPCHGSRFAPTGAVLQSPAIQRLEPDEPE